MIEDRHPVWNSIREESIKIGIRVAQEATPAAAQWAGAASPRDPRTPQPQAAGAGVRPRRRHTQRVPGTEGAPHPARWTQPGESLSPSARQINLGPKPVANLRVGHKVSRGGGVVAKLFSQLPDEGA